MADREHNGTTEQRLGRIERKVDRIHGFLYGWEPGDNSLQKTIADMTRWRENIDDKVRDLERDASSKKEGLTLTRNARFTVALALITTVIVILGGLVGDLMRALVLYLASGSGGGIP